MRSVPEGAKVVRTYLQIPGYYGNGEREFPNTDEGWDAAVLAAQAKKAAIVAQNTEALGQFGTPEAIEAGANVQVRIDLRWKMKWDARDAGTPTSGIDTVIESYKDVDRLRTRASFKPKVSAPVSEATQRRRERLRKALRP